MRPVRWSPTVSQASRKIRKMYAIKRPFLRKFGRAEMIWKLLCPSCLRCKNFAVTLLFLFLFWITFFGGILDEDVVGRTWLGDEAILLRPRWRRKMHRVDSFSHFVFNEDEASRFVSQSPQSLVSQPRPPISFPMRTKQDCFVSQPRPLRLPLRRLYSTDGVTSLGGHACPPVGHKCPKGLEKTI